MVLQPKSWWKDDIYWLLKSSCFELFGDGKYGLFSSQEVDGKYDIYWLLKSSCFEFFFSGKYGLFFESRNWWKDVSSCFEPFGYGKHDLFSVKKLVERWYLLGLFEISIKFQDLGNTVFRAVRIYSQGNYNLLHQNSIRKYEDGLGH